MPDPTNYQTPEGTTTMTNELTRFLSAGLDLLALKIRGKGRPAQRPAGAPCVAVPPEQRPGAARVQQPGGTYFPEESQPYQECLSPEAFAAVMYAHRGLETWPHSRRLEGVQQNLGWLTPAVAGLVLTLWGPQDLGGYGKSTTWTLDPEVLPHPQAGIARNWLAEYAPEVSRALESEGTVETD